MASRRHALVALMGSLFALPGCTKTGHEWVADVPGITPASDSERPRMLIDDDADLAQRSAAVEPRRVVSLGSSELLSPEVGDDVQSETTPQVVRVEHHYYPGQGTAGYYDGGYYEGGYWGWRPGNPVRPEPPIAPAPDTGVPNYGPSFPFKSAPADPWK